MDPETQQYMAYLMAPLGLGQFIYGVVVGRQVDDARDLFPGRASASSGQKDIRPLLSAVLQGGGIGLMALAAISYFASQYEWAFMVGLGAMMVCSSLGSLAGFRAMKARGQQ
jgi:hypothetical protein